MLVVADTRDEDAYVPQLEAAGYVLRIREPDWFEHRCFKGPDTNVNLHTFSDGCEEVDRMLAFRDWLRTHDDDRDLYLDCEARARDTRVEVRPELRGREVGCGAGDTRARTTRVAVGIHRAAPDLVARGPPLAGLRLPLAHTA